MKKFCSFPEIGQYRALVRSVSDRYRYVGKDENGDPIFDNSIDLPTITFKGTVKLHGTNSGITINKDGEMYPQSRTDTISIGHDNAGFAFFVESKKDIFKTFFDKIDFKGYDYVTIFGEWCGGSIQKNVAINGLPKMFVIFDVKRSYDSIEQGDNVYSDEEEIKLFRSIENNIFNIYDFETYTIEVDFNCPQKSQNRLIEITEEVEKECPVGKQLGVIGTGEGVVWTFYDNGKKYRFKVKGEKHAGKSKVKTLKPVDDVKIQKINDIAEQVTPVWRLSQMIEKSCNLNNGGAIDRTKLGVYIKMVIEDVIKEDLDILVDNNIEIKEICKPISEIARKYFFQQEQI